MRNRLPTLLDDKDPVFKTFRSRLFYEEHEYFRLKQFYDTRGKDGRWALSSLKLYTFAVPTIGVPRQDIFEGVFGNKVPIPLIEFAEIFDNTAEMFALKIRDLDELSSRFLLAKRFIGGDLDIGGNLRELIYFYIPSMLEGSPVDLEFKLEGNTKRVVTDLLDFLINLEKRGVQIHNHRYFSVVLLEFFSM